jgi:plasmid stability protein
MPKKGLRVDIDEKLHQRVRFKALTQNTTVAAIVRELLRRWVEEEKPIVLPLPTQPTGSITAK